MISRKRFQPHGEHVAGDACRAEPFLCVLEVGKLLRLEVLDRKAADRGIDHRRDQEEVPERLMVHGDDARAAVGTDIDIAFTSSRRKISRTGVRERP